MKTLDQWDAEYELLLEKGVNPLMARRVINTAIQLDAAKAGFELAKKGAVRAIYDRFGHSLAQRADIFNMIQALKFNQSDLGLPDAANRENAVAFASGWTSGKPSLTNEQKLAIGLTIGAEAARLEGIAEYCVPSTAKALRRVVENLNRIVGLTTQPKGGDYSARLKRLSGLGIEQIGWGYTGCNDGFVFRVKNAGFLLYGIDEAEREAKALEDRQPKGGNL